MKRLLILLTLIIAALGVMYGVSAAKEPHAPADCDRVYIFREYNGAVACFEEGGRTPFLVTSRKVGELTALDRELLSEGVEVKGAREMTKTLFDLTS